MEHGNKVKIGQLDDLNKSKKELQFCIIGSESNT